MEDENRLLLLEISLLLLPLLETLLAVVDGSQLPILVYDDYLEPLSQFGRVFVHYDYLVHLVTKVKGGHVARLNLALVYLERLDLVVRGVLRVHNGHVLAVTQKQELLLHKKGAE